jgi:hypothetical protein
MEHVEIRKSTHASSRYSETVVQYMGGADQVRTIVPADVEVHLDLATAPAHRVVYQHQGHLPALEAFRPQAEFIKSTIFFEYCTDIISFRSNFEHIKRTLTNYITIFVPCVKHIII